MKTVIIFGSAPYFKEIQPFIPELISKYDTIGINRAQLYFPFKTWAFCDSETLNYIEQVKPFEKGITRAIWAAHIPEEHRGKFDFYQNAGNTIIHPGHQYGKCLAFHAFTISFVLNYCYFKGYTDVYFAGIEHDGEYSRHFIRDYIYRYKKLMNLWQLDAASTLEIEKRKVSDLL